MDEAARAVLLSLAEEDNRLVVVSHDETLGVDVVEVSHEAVIREWKKLREWVAQNPAFLQWREEVERRRRRYERNGKRPDDLLQGIDLDEARSWLLTRGAASSVQTQDADISSNILAFVEDSKKQQDQDRETTLTLERERTAAARRLTRWFAVGGVVFFFLTSALIVVGLFLNKERREADIQTISAKTSLRKAQLEAKRADDETEIAIKNETKSLSAVATIALVNHRPTEAVKLGLASWPRGQGNKRPQLEFAIKVIARTISTERLPARILRHSGSVTGALLTPDGRILSWSEDKTLQLWDAKTGSQIGSTMRHDDRVVGALLMPDGLILSWSEDKTLRLWDANTGSQIGSTMRHDDRVVGVLLMPEGHILSWSEDKTLRLFRDAKTGSQIGPAMRHDDRVVGALLMPDGRILSWSADKTLRLWDAKTGSQVGPAMRHDESVVGALLMPGGHILSWSADKTLRLWDAKTSWAARSDPRCGTTTASSAHS